MSGEGLKRICELCSLKILSERCARQQGFNESGFKHKLQIRAAFT